MTITVNYPDKDFFGNSVYLDSTAYLTAYNAKKAFNAIKKDMSIGVHINDDQGGCTSFYFDSWTDFENMVITKKYAKSYYNIDTPVKMSFTKAKKEVMEMIKKIA